ncbi:MAG TPA: hypothetical protein VGM01_01575 [Ktedonobacteraceae bacterium]|jgi:hypothetical protein
MDTSQQDISNQQATEQFLALYQTYRHQDQLAYYQKRVKEFTNAQRQAIWLSIGLVFVAGLAGAFEGATTSWVRSTLLLIAAICPILSTTLAGYTALRGFTQQAKLFHDAQRNLLHIHAPEVQPDLLPLDLNKEVEKYVNKVEGVLQTEHGFWGQLAENMTPPTV